MTDGREFAVYDSRICQVCKKEFGCVPAMPRYKRRAYVKRKMEATLYFCSWSCLRKYDAEKKRKWSYAELRERKSEMQNNEPYVKIDKKKVGHSDAIAITIYNIDKRMPVAQRIKPVLDYQRARITFVRCGEDEGYSGIFNTPAHVSIRYTCYGDSVNQCKNYVGTYDAIYLDNDRNLFVSLSDRKALPKEEQTDTDADENVTEQTIPVEEVVTDSPESKLRNLIMASAMSEDFDSCRMYVRVYKQIFVEVGA